MRKRTIEAADAAMQVGSSQAKERKSPRTHNWLFSFLLAAWTGSKKPQHNETQTKEKEEKKREEGTKR